MKLTDTLQKRKAKVVDRWLDKTLATYRSDASAFFKNKADRFANPVGATLRAGTQAIFEILIEGAMDAERLCRHLDDIIRIRAVQDFSPSQAVSFVFFLKQAIREELREELGSREALEELAAFEAKIDQLSLFAFDIFVRCREQLYELRVDEVKRSVSAILKRVNRCDSDVESEPYPQHKKLETH